MAYYFALGIQAISLVIGMVGVYLLFKSMSSKEAKYFMATAICVEWFALGYFFEMIAENYGEALLSIMIQNSGLAYVGIMFSLYTTHLTKEISVPTRVWEVAFAVKTVILGFILTSKYHNIYFKEFSFVETGLYPHFEGGITFFRVFFLVSLAFELAFGVLQLILARIHTIQPRIKRRYNLAVVGGFVVLLGMGVSLMFGFYGYEPTSVLSVLVMFVIALVRFKDKTSQAIQKAYDELFDQSSMAIVILDTEGNFLNCNEEAYKMNSNLRYVSPGTSGSVILDMGGILVDQELHRLYSEGRVYSENKEELTENGKVIGHILTYTDITEIEERVKVYSELKMAAESASEAKSSFLANMSHEMRTPLNAIIGLSELSEREESLESIKKYTSQIKASGQVLLDIISDVLDFSKVESGKLEIVPTEYSLKEMINTVVNMANVRIGKKEIDFVVRINPQIPDSLFGDDVRIRQVFVNFLGNAVKYTDRGYIKFEIDYERTSDGIILNCAVEDSGKGIKEEEIDNLFKVFSRVDIKSNRNIQGTGLGLAISAQLIELMNGTYSVSSEYGMGSRFSFTIPQKVVVEDTLGKGITSDISVKKFVPFFLFSESEDAKESAQTVGNEKMNEEEVLRKKCQGKSFLVVDDNPINVKVLLAFLKLFDIEADSAASGEESIKLTQNKEYDLIFMDQMMPEMDGVEATKKIRELQVPWAQTVKIIACTANAVKGVEQMLLASGMDDYISKPIVMEELKNILDKNI